MSSQPDGGFVRNHQSLHPEEFIEAIRGAHFDVVQLSRKASPSVFRRLMFPSCCLDIVRAGNRMLYTGDMPRDMFSLVYVLDSPEPTQTFVFGLEHSEAYAALFPPGSVMDACTPPGAAHAVLTFPESAFLGKLASSYPEVSNKLLRRSLAMQVLPERHMRIRELIASIEHVMDHDAGMLHGGIPLRFIEESVCAEFLDVLREGLARVLPTTPERLHKRLMLLRHARDYMREHDISTLHPEALRAELHLSQRGLENLFKDFVGLGPAAFLKFQRLHRVRQALLRAAPCPGAVKRAALECGFWQLGHFARDYREVFGERPADSLGRES